MGPREPVDTGTTDNTPDNTREPDLLDEFMEQDGPYEGDDVPGTEADDTGDDTQFATSDGQQRDNVQSDDQRTQVQQPDTQRPAAAVPAVDPNNPNGFKRVGTAFADAKGNIVDRAGRILAARGEAARHWYDMAKQVGQIPALRNQVTVLQRQAQTNQRAIEAARELAELPSRMGITREEFNEGVGLIARWRSNPVEVARDIVARTIALGHNVSDILGKTAGDSLEMPALRRMVNEITAPLQQQREQERMRTEQVSRAQQQYDAFVARYPDAELHGNAIAQLMETQNLTAVEAYHEVRFFAQKHGLDFSQPLGPQIQAARAQQQPNGHDQSTTFRAPMNPRGSGSGNRRQQTSEPQMAAPDAGWGEILNSVMRETQ